MQSQDAKMIELAKWIKRDPPGRPVNGTDEQWDRFRREQWKMKTMMKLNRVLAKQYEQY